MQPELVAAALLSQAGISAIVGTRIALAQLPQNTAFPALAYTIISAVPKPTLSAAGSQMAMARIQVNPLAATVAGVKEIHAAIRTALDFKHQQTFAGKLVVSCRFDNLGPMDKDNDAGVWTQPADYMLYYYE